MRRPRLSQAGYDWGFQFGYRVGTWFFHTRPGNAVLYWRLRRKGVIR